MTHLPFIVASYGLAVVVTGGFAITAYLRSERAKRRLAALDPRAQMGRRSAG